ncbi:hypothetical protein V1478_003555 [Vespula squamosa]|uniref:Uncharacterized protein n=1 Tax=Vespula squamosa TaxID=30214 RepID=A0ABD2BM52_VESSQ
MWVNTFQSWLALSPLMSVVLTRVTPAGHYVALPEGLQRNGDPQTARFCGKDRDVSCFKLAQTSYLTEPRCFLLHQIKEELFASGEYDFLIIYATRYSLKLRNMHVRWVLENLDDAPALEINRDSSSIGSHPCVYCRVSGGA